MPDWLFDECYHHVGDLAETIALLLPPAETASDRPLADWVENRLLPLRGMDEERQKADVLAAWQSLDSRQRFVWNKLITGEFRVGVSQHLVVRALAEVSRLPTDTVAHRLMGDWEPTPRLLRRTRRPRRRRRRHQPPLSVLPGPPAGGRASTRSGRSGEWQAEWKWDGIRSQADPPGRTVVRLVAGRGAGHRPLPGARRRWPTCCPTAR